jgi:L-threonylcarbamoyladenylate synthase
VQFCISWQTPKPELFLAPALFNYTNKELLSSMITRDIQLTAQALWEGEVVAIPTETVYGLAACINNESAIHKIFEIKNRPLTNPLIVHTDSIGSVEKLVTWFPPMARKLAEHCWPGPLTMVLPRSNRVSSLVTAGSANVAIRIPKHPVALQLLKKVEIPLAAPSANPFGSVSPTSASHVNNYFGKELKYVLDGGPCEEGIESTIVGFDNTNVIVYRLGSVSFESLKELVPDVKLKNYDHSNQTRMPGMHLKHYAPGTPFIVTDSVKQQLDLMNCAKVGLLLFSHTIDHPSVKHVEILSRNGNMKEAASNLYAAMHRLDQSGVDIIIAEALPENGPGLAINDRLRRASL